MKVLSRDGAMAFINREPVTIECPELGAVRVRYLTGRERVTYLEDLSSGKYGSAIAAGVIGQAELLALSMVDEDGKQLFSREEVDLVSSLPVRDQKLIAETALRINGLKVEDDKGKSEPSPS